MWAERQGIEEAEDMLGKCGERESRKALSTNVGAPIALGAAALLGAAAFHSAFADSPILGPLTQISGPSPFAKCTVDNVPGQEAEGSVIFPNSEIEPYVHVNPTDADNV